MVSPRSASRSSSRRDSRGLPVHLVDGDHNWSRPQVRAHNADLIASAEGVMVLPNAGHFSFLDNASAVVAEVERVTSAQGPASDEG